MVAQVLRARSPAVDASPSRIIRSNNNDENSPTSFVKPSIQSESSSASAIDSQHVNKGFFVNPKSQVDFTWSETDEPHATRRRIILAKYPQIAKLVGPELLTCPIVFALIIFQTYLAYYFSTKSWTILLIGSYIIGGTINHSLQLAVHEISHNLAFATPLYNRILGCIANLPTCVPSSVTFQKYHMDHHQYQGVDGIDTDVPTMTEVHWFTNSLTKTIWVFLQPLFYAFRPVIVKPKQFSFWEGINWITAIIYDLLILYFINYKGLAYLFAGTLLGLGLHPSSGHFIAEHYEFITGQETYSYYGIFNYFNFNVGYHNEHHDFPKIPWSKLPKVKAIAPEFYDTLPYYTSYLYVFYRYIMDPNVGPASRVKRKSNKQLDRVLQSKSNKSSSSSLSKVGDLQADGTSSGDASADKKNEDKMNHAFKYIATAAMGSAIAGLIFVASTTS